MTEAPDATDATWDVVRAESAAMLEHLVSAGRHPSARVAAQVAAALEAGGGKELLAAHRALARLVAPMPPGEVARRHAERPRAGLAWLGPTRAARQVTTALVMTLGVFGALALSPDVTENSGTIFEDSGAGLAVNLGFLAAAAALGTFVQVGFALDREASGGRPVGPLFLGPRVVLGVVAGVVLAELLVTESMAGVTRPMLALVGGYSAGLLSTVLDRALDTAQVLLGSAGPPPPAAASPVRDIGPVDDGLAQVVLSARSALDAGATDRARNQLDELADLLGLDDPSDPPPSPGPGPATGPIAAAGPVAAIPTGEPTPPAGNGTTSSAPPQTPASR